MNALELISMGAAMATAVVATSKYISRRSKDMRGFEFRTQTKSEDERPVVVQVQPDVFLISCPGERRMT